MEPQKKEDLQMPKSIINELTNIPTTYFFNEDELKCGGAKAKKEILKMLKNFVTLKDEEITFASLNKTGECFWFTPRAEILKKDWIIILNDYKNKEVDFIYVPKDTIKRSYLKTRMSSDNKLCLHLELQKKDGYIIDRKSKLNFTMDRLYIKVTY